MIIDRILDRYDGDAYEPREFYWDMLSYGGHGVQISRAMDFGTEEDVKKALCEYIDGEYNPLIKDFINKADWLVPDNGVNWREIVAI